MSSINANVAVGRMNFTFTDEDGEVFSSFRLNPADINVANRCMEVSEQFRQREDRKITTVAEAAAYNAELEEKINYILGYDANQSQNGRAA